MDIRSFPVRPDLAQMRRQAKELLRAARGGDPQALESLVAFGARRKTPAEVRLADAQHALAKSFGVRDWPRLVQACELVRAIWADDLDGVRALVEAHPDLLHECARGVADNWGPPMSYAANLGREEIIAYLHQRGAEDLQWAFDRACLQGQIATARQLHSLGARPAKDAVMGPAETQNDRGMELLFELGAELSDSAGKRLAPVAMVLETYTRNPLGKARCLELFASRGVELPDTPPMAVHRNRLDLLEAHLQRDPGLFNRCWTHTDLYPPELGCHADPTLALHGTPLAGATLLHLCVDNGQPELVRWMLEMGAPVDARAAVDKEGFGAHSALFGCVVSQPYRVGLCRDDSMARLLLESGADPTVRASLRKELRFVADESLHEYRDVTPFEWGQRFHDRDWVNPHAMALLEPGRAS